MKAFIVVFFLIHGASAGLAQDIPIAEDTLHYITVDAGIADNSMMIGGALFNASLAYESQYWRLPLTVGLTGELNGGSTDYGIDKYTEVEFGMMGKVLSKTLLLDLGMNIGRLTHYHKTEYKAWTLSIIFFSLQGELGLGGKYMAGGLMYKRRLGEYRAGDIIGAWLRYRIPLWK